MRIWVFSGTALRRPDIGVEWKREYNTQSGFNRIRNLYTEMFLGMR